MPIGLINRYREEHARKYAIGAVDWTENLLLTLVGLLIAIVIVGAIRVFG